MSRHFDTAEGFPQTRAEVEAAPDEVLVDFMGRCAVEPADFAGCLACYAYEIAQIREALEKPLDADGALPADVSERLRAMSDELALLLARRRTGGSVFMDGRHNPTPTEVREAERFMESVGYVVNLSPEAYEAARKAMGR